MEKNIIMGMITPSGAEMVKRFLLPFRKNITLILPDEERHFKQVWDDEGKRGRSWGGEVRGWQNTIWNRLLLRGLAGDMGLNIVSEPVFPEKKMARKPGISAREARDGKHRKFIEVFFGRWAELDDNENIVAMFTETYLDENGIHVKCDQTSKACGKGLHNCEANVLLTNDVHGLPLSIWVASDKIHIPKHGHANNALIFFAGTFAPFHHGHLDAMNSAKKFLEKKGWNVLGGYASAFTDIKEDRVGALYPVLGSAQNRDALLQLGTMRSDWIMADPPTEHVLSLPLLEDGLHPIQLLSKRLRNRGFLPPDMPVTTFWLNGKDGIMKESFFSHFAEYAELDPLNKLRMLIIDNRPGQDEWSEERLTVSVPTLLPYISRYNLRPTRPTSAMEVREALKTCDRNRLKNSVGLPLVEAYLMGLMNEQDVKGHKTS
ncbi:MAG: hypothetical protein AAB731_00070 [Patescibacteria group bacterium]